MKKWLGAIALSLSATFAGAQDQEPSVKFLRVVCAQDGTRIAVFKNLQLYGEPISDSGIYKYRASRILEIAPQVENTSFLDDQELYESAIAVLEARDGIELKRCEPQGKLERMFA